MSAEDLKNIKSVYFVGIGGIGISAIARMMMLEGKKVAGSDLASSIVTKELLKMGAKVYAGHKAENLKGEIDLLVYTIAVPPTNPELVEAKKRGIPMLTYPEMLGLISSVKQTIAVAGTHGKTTTTAMVAKIFMEAKLDPTVIVGSLLTGEKSNFIAGKGEYLIAEACEYRRSFLNLNPKMVVITNIDNDHLDYYKDIKDIQSAFIALVKKIPKDGFLVCNPKGKNMAPVVRGAKCRVIDYEKITKAIKLKLAGAHNQRNAKAALSVAEAVGLKKTVAEKALAQFAGTWRRFEFKGKTQTGAAVYDDYAHHPTEIKATLAGAREFFGKKKKIIAVFQPHLFSRTKLLIKDFAKSFDDADLVIVTDIYAAREVGDGTVSSQDLAYLLNKKNKPIYYLNNFKEIEKFLRDHTGRNEVVITIGAGDVYKIGEALVK